MRWLMIGAGYSAQTFARLIAGEVEAISGTTRGTDKFGALEAAGIAPLQFDGTTIPQALLREMAQATHLLHAAAPGNGADPFLNLIEGPLAETMPKLQWVGYLSTVGVYGNHDGAWVDEESACLATSKRGIARIDAERAWLNAGEAPGISVAVLRLAGIYGPGRNAFTKLKEGKAHRIVKQGQLFSRIHVDDIAGAARHLAALGIGGTFNLADNEPAPPQDVIAYAAELMGVEPPPEIPFEKAEMSAMARSFYADSRKVSNAKLRASGYELHYPDYRTALPAMWREGSWR
ncbi:MAG: SDR family oxidoreductase [Rhizobiaceae bacterium]|nr:SDR family oxidoreductase [Rhizobiaceae bacterium]